MAIFNYRQQCLEFSAIKTAWKNFFIRVIYVDKTVDNRPLQKSKKEKSVYPG